ncbi:hypothetical protein SAMN06298216_1159 [Spirosomataceae bacterium TFI 002]|nr:hypothetical protein SAMN06298216_1159 [Spirosomataceae bacterium TFI 002]
MTKYLIFIVIFSFLSIAELKAQENTLSSADSLYANRKAFTTRVSRGTEKLDNSRFALLLQPSRKWSKKFTISRIILPAGPLVAAGGVYLAYDAIKGIPMQAEIDGVIYPYTVRSLPQLLGGIAIFVGGMSMIESANETKANSVNWYNGYLSTELENNKSSYNKELRFGIQESGRIGFVMKF